MLAYESQVVVNRPPDSVFRYLVEPERQALWSDVPMRPLTEGPLGPGSRLEVTFGMGPVKATVGLEFTAVEPARRPAAHLAAADRRARLCSGARPYPRR